MPKPHPSWSLLRIFTTTADESTVWALPPPPTDVRFVVATWCKAHRRWYNPRTCFRCLSTHTQVGVRVGPEVVRRVVSQQNGSLLLTGRIKVGDWPAARACHIVMKPRSRALR